MFYRQRERTGPETGQHVTPGLQAYASAAAAAETMAPFELCVNSPGKDDFRAASPVCTVLAVGAPLGGKAASAFGEH